MSRRAPRPEREIAEPPSESPWLMRGTFLLIPLLFLGCWVLTYRTLQPREAAGGAPGAPPTPTTSLALKLPASASGPGHQGPPETATPGLPGAAPTAMSAATTAEPSPTPTATAVPTASPAPTPAGTTYVVKSGDTLSSIARSSNVSVEAIAAANHLQPPYPLQVGDRLIIPAR